MNPPYSLDRTGSWYLARNVPYSDFDRMDDYPVLPRYVEVPETFGPETMTDASQFAEAKYGLSAALRGEAFPQAAAIILIVRHAVQAAGHGGVRFPVNWSAIRPGWIAVNPDGGYVLIDSDTAKERGWE